MTVELEPEVGSRVEVVADTNKGARWRMDHDRRTIETLQGAMMKNMPRSPLKAL